MIATACMVGPARRLSSASSFAVSSSVAGQGDSSGYQQRIGNVLQAIGNVPQDLGETLQGGERRHV